MKLHLHSQAAKVLSALTCFSVLAGCGGGSDAQSGPNSTALLSNGTVNAPAANANANSATNNSANGNSSSSNSGYGNGNNVAGSGTTSSGPTTISPVTPPSTGSTTTGSSSTGSTNTGYTNTGSTSTGSTVTPPAVTPPPPTTTDSSAGTTAPVAPSATSGTITDVKIQNTATTAQTNVPVTFGQVFAVGAVAPTDALVGKLDDGTAVPLQVDVKALHADGSVRHAIISAVVPTLGASQVRTISMMKGGKAAAATALATSNMMANGFSASVSATINGVKYTAYADDLIKKATAPKTWLAGNIVNEWQVSAPLTSSSGAAHPHLTARFAVRWYQNIKKARVDVTVENDWAYEPNPQNFTYDASVLVGAKQVYAKTGMTHYHHARWRKVFWWNGDTPQINIKHNIPYLIASGAVPNYDQTVQVPDSALADLATRYTGSVTEPMGIGLGVPYMLMTGGRPDIGIMPQWSTLWLLTMDQRARTATLGTADGAGSWSAHYRDKSTDRPVSLIDHPYMTIYGNASDTVNPATNQREAFPACASATACDTPYTHDPDHQPAFVYLPYLLTGDYYYLEELQFWAMWDAFASNPAYRQYAKGLVSPEQVRGQAWCLRTLAEAAYITPDADRLKSHLVSIVNANLDWYNATYTNNASANQLGAVTNGYAMAYNNSTGLAPWQDDFFTSVIGHAAEMGFDKAKTFLVWKSKFPVDRMTAPGACWIDATIYAMNIRDTSTSPFYTTMGDVYAKNHTAAFDALACGSAAMATALKLQVGEMTGYSSDPAGYPSNLQPALAYASDALGAKGKAAWTLFMNRSVKPNYGSQPQFAIVPRH